MRTHRKSFRTGGNCFDLVLWLIAELAEAGIAARPVGHDLETPDAHIAVVAQADGISYLCDLGDQWLQPVLIDPGSPAFSTGWLAGFFPAAEIRVEPAEQELRVFYRFPDGRENAQAYSLAALDADTLACACRHSQGLLRKPMVEILARHPETGEQGAWEFDRFRSFWRLSSGRRFEADCEDLTGWVERIAARSGMSPEVVEIALRVYALRDVRS